MAQQWIVRCDSPGPTAPLCLDATTDQSGGRVQVSECGKTKTYQQWDTKNEPFIPVQIKNRGMGNCVDINVYSNPADNKVVTNPCQSYLQAQQWIFKQQEGGTTLLNSYTGQCLGGDPIAIHTAEPVGCGSAPKWRFANVGDMRLGCPP
jgi:hypothetical protein